MRIEDLSPSFDQYCNSKEAYYINTTKMTMMTMMVPIRAAEKYVVG